MRQNNISGEEIVRLINNDPTALLGLLLAQGRQDPKNTNTGVVRDGDKIIVPEGAHLPDIIRSLERQHNREEQITQIHVTIPVPVWDGAMALKRAIEENTGVFNQKVCSCGSPGCGAHQMEVEVENGKAVQVPWGTFELPGMEDGEVETGTATEDGRTVFACHITCKKRYEPRVRLLLDKVRELATKESLHRGKAFSIKFHDEKGKLIQMPKPKFFEYLGETPIFKRSLEASIERYIAVPIKHADHLLAMGEPLKRGVLFAGKFGVGKTLLASHIARIATSAGWTFIYVKDSTELPDALRFAQQYQPVVVFAEDIDRIAGTERTDKVNELLNQLDGIDSKMSKIMTILTSNHPELINDAMRRPGRIDLVLEVEPPDAETVVRIITQFADGNLETETDLTNVSHMLAGETPARIRETIGRAKLEALRRTGDPQSMITGADLEIVAQEVKAEGNLFQRNEVRLDKHNITANMADGFAIVADTLRKSSNGSRTHAVREAQVTG